MTDPGYDVLEDFILDHWDVDLDEIYTEDQLNKEVEKFYMSERRRLKGKGKDPDGANSLHHFHVDAYWKEAPAHIINDHLSRLEEQAKQDIVEINAEIDRASDPVAIKNLESTLKRRFTEKPWLNNDVKKMTFGQYELKKGQIERVSQETSDETRQQIARAMIPRDLQKINLATLERQVEPREYKQLKALYLEQERKIIDMRNRYEALKSLMRLGTEGMSQDSVAEYKELSRWYG